MKYEKRALLGLLLVSWSIIGVRAALWNVECKRLEGAPSPVPVRWLLAELDEVYVQFPRRQRTTSQATSRQQKSSRHPIVKVNLNTADSASLEGMPYIGSWLAARICRFREALGGFHDVEQLREVWGLHTENADRLIPRFHIGSGVFRQICVDTATWRSLRQHPYISSREASAIERYRDHHALDSIEDLAHAVPITDSMIRRWSPYLRLCEIRGQSTSLH